MTFDIDKVRVTEGHKALAAYIKSETGKGVKPEAIALIDTLRAQYRKDPTRVAERDARAEAARARREAAYEKALAKARELAEKLGKDDFTPRPAQPASPEPEAEPARLSVVPEPEPEPEPAPARRRQTPAEPTPATEEKLVPEIDVMEDYEGWETASEGESSEGEPDEGESDDFFDEPEGEDY